MKEKEKIGIIGQGFVGSATREGMQNYFDILAYDKDPQKNRTVNSILEVVQNTEMTFLCVPTPMRKSGECDLSILKDALTEIKASVNLQNRRNYIVVIKSTIPPGTTDMLNELYGPTLEILFNPEFLTEANANEDFKNQNRIIIGGERPGSTKVKQIFYKAFPNIPIIKTSSTIAEMIKYVTNTFLATKVSFANEMYGICQGLGIDYDKVIEYARYDTRLGNSHWSVPGPDRDFGYGGHCFPGFYTIKTTDGDISLSDAYQKFINNEPISVMSFDSNITNTEIKKVKEVTQNLYEGELIKFELEDGKTIKCTPEHYFPINRNEKILIVQAKNITKTDTFFIRG